MNTISKFAYVDPRVKMGDNNVILEGAIIRRGVTIGDGNIIGPNCIIGDPPEKKGFLSAPGHGVIIGDGNHFSKGVHIDSGSERPTVVVDNTILLSGCYIGHDSKIRSNVVVCAGAKIGGFVTVDERVTIGLNAAIHQRVQIPEGCIIGMSSTVVKRSKLEPNRKYAGSPVVDIGENIR